MLGLDAELRWEWEDDPLDGEREVVDGIGGPENERERERERERVRERERERERESEGENDERGRGRDVDGPCELRSSAGADGVGFLCLVRYSQCPGRLFDVCEFSFVSCMYSRRPSDKFNNGVRCFGAYAACSQRNL